MGRKTSETPVPPAATVVGVELGTIGKEGDGEESLLGDVMGIASDGQQVVYVADRMDSSVRAFGLDGGLLGIIGGEGDGPGEFRFPHYLDVDPAGRLHVWDRSQVSVFATRVDSGFADSLLFTVRRPQIRAPRRFRARFDGEFFWGPSYDFADFKIGGYHYVVFDRDGAVVDTVHVPSFPNPELTGSANYPVNERGFGRNLPGLSRVPFEPEPSWDVSAEGTVVFSSGTEGGWVVVDVGGDTVSRVEIGLEARPVPSGELADSVAALASRLDSVPVPLDQLRNLSPRARSGRLPVHYPELTSILSADGEVWVRRWPWEPNTTLLDVFESDGTPVARISLEGDLQSAPPLWIRDGVVVGVVVDRVTHAQMVKVFSVPEVY